MAIEEERGTPKQQGTPVSAVDRATVGRVLVGIAIFAPALLIVGLLLLSRGSIYSQHFSGSKWPWIASDIALLLVGMRLMRGEDL